MTINLGEFICPKCRKTTTITWKFNWKCSEETIKRNFASTKKLIQGNQSSNSFYNCATPLLWPFGTIQEKKTYDLSYPQPCQKIWKNNWSMSKKLSQLWTDPKRRSLLQWRGTTWTNQLPPTCKFDFSWGRTKLRNFNSWFLLSINLMILRLRLMLVTLFPEELCWIIPIVLLYNWSFSVTNFLNSWG